VEPVRSLESARGVDVDQIRRQLAMTVPERVRSMVASINIMLEVQRQVRASRAAPPK
jgi:hypothetical protein